MLQRALASPFGILIVFPAIALSVGLFLTLVGQRALEASNRALGQHRLAEQAKVGALHLRGTLETADAVLDRLSDFSLTHSPDKTLEPAAAVLFDLIQGRAGVAYVSISFPDGTFQGAYVEGGRVMFQDSRVGVRTTQIKRYDYRGHDSLTLLDEETSRYDPRQRAVSTRKPRRLARAFGPARTPSTARITPALRARRPSICRMAWSAACTPCSP